MTKKQPIKVTIKETRHKKQKWTVTIDMPGNNPLDELRERYARAFTAKRGAIRKLKAGRVFDLDGSRTGDWACGSKSNWRFIEFVVVRLKNSGPKKQKK